jgi:catechol 2,3-dioxygenase-like lactoylglutathione lyase family enzyme
MHYRCGMRTILLVAALLVAGCKRHAPPMAELASKCTAGDFGCPVPILYVHDLATSQRYFRDQLGFKLDWTDSDDFASVSRGKTQLFLCQRCQGNAGSWLWVITPDVDKLYADLRKRGAKIKAEPKNQPWGLREMQVADVDGNVMRIGSPIEHD